MSSCCISQWPISRYQVSLIVTSLAALLLLYNYNTAYTDKIFLFSCGPAVKHFAGRKQKAISTFLERPGSTGVKETGARDVIVCTQRVSGYHGEHLALPGRC